MVGLGIINSSVGTGIVQMDIRCILEEPELEEGYFIFRDNTSEIHIELAKCKTVLAVAHQWEKSLRFYDENSHLIFMVTLGDGSDFQHAFMHLLGSYKAAEQTLTAAEKSCQRLLNKQETVSYDRITKRISLSSKGYWPDVPQNSYRFHFSSAITAVVNSTAAVFKIW